MRDCNSQPGLHAILEIRRIPANLVLSLQKHDGFAASCEMRLPVEVEEAIVARSIQLVSRSGKFVSRRSETKMK